MRAPVHLRYSPDHEWVASGATARIGITAYAADALGDIVFVDLPAVGQRVSSGQACAEIESTKSVSDIVSPVDGVVVAVNDALSDDPAIVNREPYDAGWLFEVDLDGEPAGLLSAVEYEALVEP
ncbi:MAG TPA: glycine cleavage system protein GcvH [Acidimicrobiales bacterium]